MRAILRRAFGAGSGEADLVDALRTAGDHVAELCLVAVEGELVVGHLFFSSARLASGDEVLALAPLAVAEAWMALPLPAYRPQARGLVSYAAAFDAVV